MAHLKQLIKQSVRSITQQSDFVAWLSRQKLNPGDLVALNNSYALREFGTNKSPYFLALQCNAAGKLADLPQVVEGVRINGTYKHLSAGIPDLPTLVDLDTAIEDQLDTIGTVVFVLIGRVDDNVVISGKLDRDGFRRVIWDPTARVPFRVDQGDIFICDAYDEERLWQELEAYCKANAINPSAELRSALGRTLEELQSNAVAQVTLPSRKSLRSDGMTDLVVGALRAQRDAYASALAVCQGNSSTDASAFNELLRIAYNFAKEAMTYVELVVNVCDLKPLVFWATIREHHALAEAFQALPPMRAGDKPSLHTYVDTVGNARNSAFHNIFPFRKSLKVSLPDAALKKPALLLFPEYNRRTSGAGLVYQDKELVEILLKFTRARSRQVAPEFWKKNLAVMDGVIELLDATSRVLKVIYSIVNRP